MGFEDDDDHDPVSMALKAMLLASLSLLVIVLIIVFFHFYLRYLLRSQQRRQFDSFHNITTQITPEYPAAAEGPSSGLDPLIIASLPKLLYKQTDLFIQGEDMECSVCLGTILEDAIVRVLPSCKHMFHVDCVDTWFRSNTTCPICRTVAIPGVQPAAGQGQVQATAPPDDEDGGPSWRVRSFREMVRSFRGNRSSDGFAFEDMERH